MRIHLNKKKTESYQQTLYQTPEMIYKNRPLSISNKEWTSDTWKFLHLITFTYPTFPTYDKQQKMKLFLENLNLPCDICEQNYSKYIEKNPITIEVLKSRENLVDWMISFRIHERENQKLIYNKELHLGQSPSQSGLSSKLNEYTKESIIYFYEQFDKTVIDSKNKKACCSG